MASRLTSMDKRAADISRQDSSGLPAVVMARTGSAELVHGLRHKPAIFSAPATQPLKSRSPSRTTRSATLTADAVEQSVKNAPGGNKSINFFPAQFQPTPPETARRVLTVSPVCKGRGAGAFGSSTRTVWKIVACAAAGQIVRRVLGSDRRQPRPPCGLDEQVLWLQALQGECQASG